MIKISLVPDTNVLISNLDIIKKLYKCNLNVLYSINYSKTVIEELDNLKKKSVQARNAIKYIDEVSKDFKTEIEGKIDDRKMDVVVESSSLIKEKNNDDKILNYCLAIENPIFLTNDVILCLKCESVNLKCIKVEKKDIKKIVSEIHKIIGLQGDEKLKQAQCDLLEVIKDDIRRAIEPRILDILHKNLGENYKLLLNEPPTLEFYLKLVKNNFFLFKAFVPKGSANIIDEYLVLFKNKNINKIKELSGTICVIFNTNIPESLK